jgi:hypothetical protein
VTGDIRSFADVHLDEGAKVEGSVVSAGSIEIHRGSSVSGPVNPNTAPVLPAFPTIPTSTVPETARVRIEAGHALSVAPGSYKSIEVEPGATLSLTTGTYFVSSFDVDETADVHLETSGGPVILVVDGIEIHSRMFVDGLHPVAQLSIDYLGRNDLHVLAPFGGTIIASRAKLLLEAFASSREFAGQFFAESIETHEDVTVTHAPLMCQ